MPTVAEAGLPGFEASSWFGVLPRRERRLRSSRASSEVNKWLQKPEGKQQLVAQGAEVFGGPPGQFSAYIRTETEKWRRW